MAFRVVSSACVLFVVSCALVACGGGHLGGNSALPQSGHRGVLDYSPGDTLYVSDATEVNAFAIDATNSTAPTRTITPHINQSGLSIAGIATDASGQLEILQNRSAHADCRIVIDPSSANGTSAAAGQFACNTAASGSSGYVVVTGIAITRDPIGVSYLESVNDATQYGDFVQRANTDTSPAGTASTGPTDNGGSDGSSIIALSGPLSSHHGIVEGVGGHVYVSSTQYGAARIDNFLAAAHGSTPPTHTFTLSGRVSAGALALASDNTLYVATTDGSGNAYVDSLPASSVGAGAPTTSIGPIGQSSITALTVDAQGNIYVALTANASAPGGAASATHVRVYAAGASGKATPVRILQDPVPIGQSITGLAIAQAPYATQPAPSPMPSPSPTVTEYPVRTASAAVSWIAAGPDGALWFLEQSANKIGRITTAGAVIEYPIATSNSNPELIAVGSDGALWFTELSANKVGRITTTGAVTEYPVTTTNSQPYGIATGVDGALWFTEVGANKIGRITTAGAVTEYSVTTANAYSVRIAAGADGALWFTELNANKIGRITTAGTVTEYLITTANSGPAGIAGGPDGALWFTEQTANQIGRITTAGAVTEYLVTTANSHPTDIAAGPDGALWFTEQTANQIGRITTAGVVTEYPVTTASAQPLGIAAGSDGALWFTEASVNKIGRIK